jgi:pimeloyl-ACP methyl ester carboxylesterase
MVRAPNKSLVGYELSQQFSPFDEGHNGMLNIKGVSQKNVDLPLRKITLSFIDIPPANYGFTYQTKALLHNNGKVRRITTDWQWFDSGCMNTTTNAHFEKTLVLLHGWGRNKNSLLSYGLAFAQQGYRVIIPDLRGHGDSTGDWVSFGEAEGRDITALMDKLNIEKYDLIGFSLGGSSGLHISSLDKRVNQLVVVAPMHSLAATIPKFAKQSPAWLGDIVLNYKDSALALVNEISGYRYIETSDSISPAKLITKPVLFVYGSIDKMSDYHLNYQLFKLGSKANQLKRLEGLRHTHVLLHQSVLMPVINQWLGVNTVTVDESSTNDCSFEKFHY